MAKEAAVLGGGLQGCCAALALRRRGFDVRIFDKSRALFSRASANQEGKIHLGFVYARDRSMVTPRTMIAHALQFAPAIESLVGAPLDWAPHLSERFHCGIHRDSTLTPEEHHAHFRALQEIYEELTDDHRGHYLGRRPKRIWHEDSAYRFHGNGLVDAVRTEETAVHPAWLRSVLVAAVEQDPQITTRLRHHVEHVEKRGAGFSVRGTNGQGAWSYTADIVVNCLWEGRHKVDGQILGTLDAGWVTRVKYGFLVESTPALRALPSLIVTHGPFGDIVNFPHDNEIYLTWYPACMVYMGHTADLPDRWDAVCDGQHAAGLVEETFSKSVAALAEYVPELAHLKLKQVLAGSIMGRGETDIDDVHSGLHLRQGIGVEASGGYYSIFTGKLTSAPANAMALLDVLG